MKAIAMSAILAALAACTPARATTIEDLGLQRGGQPAGGAFDLTVSFGSLCCGIDATAFEAVTAHVERSRSPATAVTWAWGREGERSLGLTFADDVAREAFACELLALRERLGRERTANTSLPDPAFEITGAQTKSCR